MLTERKTDTHHYFLDAKNRFQGEAKRWWINGNIYEHSFYVDDELHGESKWWRRDGTLMSHEFFVHDELYRDLIENPVDDKDKFIITLETGGKWLS